MENPYQSPESEENAVGITSGRREDLIKVANYQKGVIVCILVYFIALGCQFFLPEMRSLLLRGMLAVGVLAAVFAFLLSMQIYPRGVGGPLGILVLVPLLELFVLVVINSKATKILKRNGVHVGFLGARKSDL